ncbi:Cadherin-5 [Saguinus oedipus]|uniref:Cadherin-5 n=1 Tax=Saguinus oedipus TaxID=9490 RepID=A0ABQ9TLA6_SAGOE|nr:Cadherin-5 [Saguinus oedipus]
MAAMKFSHLGDLERSVQHLTKLDGNEASWGISTRSPAHREVAVPMAPSSNWDLEVLQHGHSQGKTLAQGHRRRLGQSPRRTQPYENPAFLTLNTNVSSASYRKMSSTHLHPSQWDNCALNQPPKRMSDLKENLWSESGRVHGKCTLIKSSVNRKNAKYLLKGQYVGKVFRVDAETGDVFAIERLDRENISEYHLIAVIADKDTGENLETPSNFTIKVHDVNDNWPVFSHRLFNASVPESSAVGTSVTSVTAVDADDPTVAYHTSVMYQILKGKEYFAIDNTGLIVTATKNLDREKQARYEIVVEARDAQGLRGESGTATVLVTLQDINDNFPYFTQTKYTFAVPEDTRVGTSVGSLFVKDPDEPQNRMTKYSILRGDYQDAFTIETNPTHNEGIIKPMKLEKPDQLNLEEEEEALSGVLGSASGMAMQRTPLDYEHIQQYSFIVEATDPTIDLRYLSVPAGNRAQVIINIIDVDEPPVFQQHFYHFQLKENQKKPLIGTVLAKDPDAARHNIG